MYKQQNRSKKLIWIYTLLLTAALGCKDDDGVDSNSPAYLIKESEKLSIPVEVDVPAGSVRVSTYFAKGYQIYRAQQVPGSDPATFEWVFAAPVADLYDENNKHVGAHFAGPTWQLSSTDSKINAQPFSPARIKNVDANSIDWLLLMPKSGTTATGIFADVDYIQRIATTGGRAPSTPPSGATGEIGVEYTAIYRFTKN